MVSDSGREPGLRPRAGIHMPLTAVDRLCRTHVMCCGMAQMIHPTGRGTGDETFSPDAAQRAVITHADGHLRVLAGPGTGKTSVIVESVKQRLRSGQPAGSLLLILTYGRLAARELRQRLTSGDQAVPVATTFHSLAYRLLASADPGLRLMGARSRRRCCARSSASRRTFPGAGVGRASRGLTDQMRSLHRRAQSHWSAAAGAAHCRSDDGSAAAVYAEYLDIMGFAGLMDYAELIRDGPR